MVIQEVCIYRYGKILTKHLEKVNRLQNSMYGIIPLGATHTHMHALPAGLASALGGGPGFEHLISYVIWDKLVTFSRPNFLIWKLLKRKEGEGWGNLSSLGLSWKLNEIWNNSENLWCLWIVEFTYSPSFIILSKFLPRPSIIPTFFKG